MKDLKEIAAETDCQPKYISKGIAMALFYLARCLHEGCGVVKDQQAAQNYYSEVLDKLSADRSTALITQDEQAATFVQKGIFIDCNVPVFQSFKFDPDICAKLQQGVQYSEIWLWKKQVWSFISHFPLRHSKGIEPNCVSCRVSNLLLTWYARLFGTTWPGLSIFKQVQLLSFIDSFVACQKWDWEILGTLAGNPTEFTLRCTTNQFSVHASLNSAQCRHLFQRSNCNSEFQD